MSDDTNEYTIATSIARTARTARALRPMLINKNEQPIHYAATSFEQPYSGCEITIRRTECVGMLVAE